MGDALAVDLAALERAWREVRRAAAEIGEATFEGVFGESVGALPSTDTSAACADLARRLGAGVLALADSLQVTSDAVAGAAEAYRTTDAVLAAAAGRSA
jgi:hypothetical protein